MIFKIEAFAGSDFTDNLFVYLQSENCQVVFVKSISTWTPSPDTGSAPSFPDMSHDPFTPVNGSMSDHANTIASQTSRAKGTASQSIRPANRPAPPPTPSLVELPTCPVCLERMDESTGLLTILCQHVFHCTCLQKWKGSGCPVCRFTHSSMPGYGRISNGANSADEAALSPPLNECSVCHSDVDLWICLICGYVGCGRYNGAHAFQHYEASSHSFAMDLTSQRVWDYTSDAYVHRIIQDQTDGKFVELTHPEHDPDSQRHHLDRYRDSSLMDVDTDADLNDTEYVPRSKLNSIGLEYTALLTSQLDSQRLYYEEILHRATDKTSSATSAADSVSAQLSSLSSELATLRLEHDAVVKSTVPQLERDKDRAVKRSERFESMARKMEREWRDEKAMTDQLLARIKGLENVVEGLKGHVGELEEEKRDLMFFVSGGEKLRALTGQVGAPDTQETQKVGEDSKQLESSKKGPLNQQDLEGASIVLPERNTAGPSGDTDKSKGKRKGKGKR